MQITDRYAPDNKTILVVNKYPSTEGINYKPGTERISVPFLLEAATSSMALLLLNTTPLLPLTSLPAVTHGTCMPCTCVRVERCSCKCAVQPVRRRTPMRGSSRCW